MKFQLDLGMDSPGAYIEALPTTLDGFPLIEKLTVSRTIKTLSPDRCVVASVLAFAPFMSGQHIFPQQFSALTAELAQRLLRPTWAHLTPLHPGNVPIPRGSREIGLVLNDEKTTTSSQLRLVPNIGQLGSRYEPNSLVVATNAIDIDVINESVQIHPSRARLAVAILLAEDLDVSNFVVTHRTFDSLQLNEAVVELLNSVSIGIRVDDE